MVNFVALLLPLAPVLVFFLPLLLPWGKWLASYAVATSVCIPWLFVSATQGSSQNDSAGSGFSIMLFLFLGFLHLAGFACRGLRIAWAATASARTTGESSPPV